MSPILRRIFQLLILVTLQAAILFVCAGDWRWAEGWWYISLYVLCLVVASTIMIPNRAEVVEERSRGDKGGKVWDIWITRLMTIPTLGILVLAGLDQRFGWLPNFNLTIQIIGGALFLIGYVFVLWAMYTNKFFSSIVRIQTERGHVAVTGGPYHYIRHPGYFGMLTSALGGVLMLNSAWALIAWMLYAPLVILRTALEDRTLQNELPGYAEFAKTTRYRLIPFIW